MRNIAIMEALPLEEQLVAYFTITTLRAGAVPTCIM